MQAIREALERLNGAINGLDGQVGQVEDSLKGIQRDMFGAPVGKPSNQNSKDVARRIDNAIQTVEKLLKEG